MLFCSTFYIGSSLSNASALWALTAVLISVTLRRTYPGGVLAREYDQYGRKYPPGSVPPISAKHAQVYPMSDKIDENDFGSPSRENRIKSAAGSSGPPDSYEMMERGANSSNGDMNENDQNVSNTGNDGIGGVNDKVKEKDRGKDKKEEKEGWLEMCIDECTGC